MHVQGVNYKILHFNHPKNTFLYYRGKVAFVTGGGTGIGFTIAEILMRYVSKSRYIGHCKQV